MAESIFERKYLTKLLSVLVMNPIRELGKMNLFKKSITKVICSFGRVLSLINYLGRKIVLINNLIIIKKPIGLVTYQISSQTKFFQQKYFIYLFLLCISNIVYFSLLPTFLLFSTLGYDSWVFSSTEEHLEQIPWWFDCHSCLLNDGHYKHSE